MFGLFEKSQGPRIKITNKVWMSKQAKYDACKRMLELDPFMVFVTFFPATKRDLVDFLNADVQGSTVSLTSETFPDLLRNRIVVFAEHHPLISVEEKEIRRLMLDDVSVLVSLDEPFFKTFGGDKTIAMMNKLGINENEILDHSFIDKAIRNAQEKISKKVIVEQPAPSQEEWFNLNFNKGT